MGLIPYRHLSPRKGEPGVEPGGGVDPAHHRVEDVAGDGTDDLVSFLRTAETGLDGDGEAVLHWDRDESREHGYSGRNAVAAVGSR